MDTQKVQINIGDVVLFTPKEDVVVCDPKFDSTLAIIDFVADDNSEVCLHTFDNRRFQAIKIDCVEVLDHYNVKMLIDEAKEFYDKVYWKPDLQIVIDLMEDFDNLLERCRMDPVYDKECMPVPDEFGALSYNISVLISAIIYQREEGWTCGDLEILNTMYRYLDILCSWWR